MSLGQMVCVHVCVFQGELERDDVLCYVELFWDKRKDLFTDLFNFAVLTNKVKLRVSVRASFSPSCHIYRNIQVFA